MLFAEATVPLPAFEAASGWHLRPEGLCQDDICVPLRTSPLRDDGALDVRIVAAALGMPLVEDASGLVALGPRAREPVLPANARAPRVVLPDVHGEPFDLASLLGTKVLLLVWASW